MSVGLTVMQVQTLNKQPELQIRVDHRHPPMLVHASPLTKQIDQSSLPKQPERIAPISQQVLAETTCQINLPNKAPQLPLIQTGKVNERDSVTKFEIAK